MNHSTADYYGASALLKPGLRATYTSVKGDDTIWIFFAKIWMSEGKTQNGFLKRHQIVGGYD